MRYFEELHHEPDHHPFLYNGLGTFLKNEGKVDQFTAHLKKLLNEFDDDETVVRKVVDTALYVEFDNKLAKKDSEKMINVIASAILSNEDIRKETLTIAHSIVNEQYLHKRKDLIN